MNLAWKSMDQRGRCNLLGGVILLVGLGSALLIYAAAERQAQRAADAHDAYANTYTLAPENSKKFLHDMEVYGGKANVLMFKFRIWFVELWQGKPLAYTIAGLSLLTAFLVFYLGGFLAPRPLSVPAEEFPGGQTPG